MRNKILLLIFIFCTSALNITAQNFLIWATYYGGNSADQAFNLTTDLQGNVYMTGLTASLTGIATAGSHQSTFGGGGFDAYLVKFDGAGNRLWATYYGGPGSDYGYAVKTDAAGNVYLIGYTSSTSGIATAGTYQPVFNAVTDAFIVKFNSSGVRQWGSYYGGADYDQALGVTTDASGNVYMNGYTQSVSGFSTPGAHQLTNAGGSDGFLAKFNASNGTLIWGTYYGGSDEDYFSDVATDALGNVIASGYTYSSSGIATAGGFQNSYAGLQDAFVVKFNPSGVRQWATYYGGSSVDFGSGIATGPGNVIYLTGQTASTNNISSGGFQNTFGGARDAYLIKFDAGGNRIWGTYYGGTVTEEGIDVATDAWGNVFISGDTYSSNAGNVIATPNGVQTNLNVTENHYLAAFLPNGMRASATYYGANHEEEAHLAVNVFGDIYLAGFTPSATGISSGGFQNTFGGGPDDAMLVKFATGIVQEINEVPNDTLPPVPTSTGPLIYISIDVFKGGGISISNAILKNFSPGKPLPVSGSTNITFTCDFTADYSTGGGTIPVSCPATVTMKVDFESALGSTRMYTSELLQLDVSGGTLPAGVEIRESPTKRSLGLVVSTDINSGHYDLSSFFDVFTELTTDSGQNWQPSTASPARMDLQSETPSSVPTLGEWGLILLAALTIGVGIFFVKQITVG